MKATTALLIAALGAGSLACGGAGVSGTELSSVAVPLTEPWTALNLPVGDGTVILSDPTTVTVTYAAGDVAALGARYAQAIRDAGWQETFKTDEMGMFTAQFTRDGATLSLAVIQAMGVTTVSITKT